jgi:hypothetical protein
MRISRVPGGIRTPNLLIRSQKLYPVELQALGKLQFSISDLRFFRMKLGDRQSQILNQFWVADGTRTRNNQNHNLGLYH